MAIRTIKIGSMEDIHQYDDAVDPYAVETDGIIAAASYTTSGATGNYTVLSSIRAGGGGALGIQYRTRQFSFSNGLCSSVGAESAWNDI